MNLTKQGRIEERYRHVEPQGKVGANTLYSVLASDWREVLLWVPVPQMGGIPPLSYETSSPRPQTVTSLHSHDVFWVFSLSLFFVVVFLKKERKKEKEKERAREKGPEPEHQA